MRTQGILPQVVVSICVPWPANSRRPSRRGCRRGAARRASRYRPEGHRSRLSTCCPTRLWRHLGGCASGPASGGGGDSGPAGNLRLDAGDRGRGEPEIVDVGRLTARSGPTRAPNSHRNVTIDAAEAAEVIVPKAITPPTPSHAELDASLLLDDDVLGPSVHQ